MPPRNLYRRLLLAGLSEGSCRIAVNRRRAAFDGNAYLLALLCTPSCRNTAGGPLRTVPLSYDTVVAEEATSVVVTSVVVTSVVATSVLVTSVVVTSVVATLVAATSVAATLVAATLVVATLVVAT